MALGARKKREIGDGERKAADAEDVSDEVGDLLFDVEVRALHQGHHGDERGDAHDESKDGERGAELVGSDGVHGERDVIRKVEQRLI